MKLLMVSFVVFGALGLSQTVLADNPFCAAVTAEGEAACNSNAGLGCYWMPPTCTGTSPFCADVTPEGIDACNSNAGLGCYWMPGTCTSN